LRNAVSALRPSPPYLRQVGPDAIRRPRRPHALDQPYGVAGVDVVKPRPAKPHVNPLIPRQPPGQIRRKAACAAYPPSASRAGRQTSLKPMGFPVMKFRPLK